MENEQYCTFSSFNIICLLYIYDLDIVREVTSNKCHAR